jgi:hypothetical protein
MDDGSGLRVRDIEKEVSSRPPIPGRRAPLPTSLMARKGSAAGLFATAWFAGMQMSAGRQSLVTLPDPGAGFDQEPACRSAAQPDFNTLGWEAEYGVFIEGPAPILRLRLKGPNKPRTIRFDEGPLVELGVS